MKRVRPCALLAALALGCAAQFAAEPPPAQPKLIPDDPARLVKDMADAERERDAAKEPPKDLDEQPKPGDPAAREYWAKLLAGPVTPEAWAESPADTPEVAEAKRFLSRGFGLVLSQCAWEQGRRKVQIQPVDNIDTNPIVIARYVSGRNQYIGLISPGPMQRIRIFFPDGEYQYEPAECRFAGKSEGAGIVLLTNRVHWLAVYPYKMTGMSLAVEPAKALPGATVKARVRLSGTSQPGLHCLRVVLVGPDSVPLPGYPRYVTAGAGEAEIEVALPPDARPGAYGLSAMCVVTAALAADTITVEKPDTSAGR